MREDMGKEKCRHKIVNFDEMEMNGNCQSKNAGNISQQFT
jgi:hypothetical protein